MLPQMIGCPHYLHLVTIASIPFFEGKLRAPELCLSSNDWFDSSTTTRLLETRKGFQLPQTTKLKIYVHTSLEVALARVSPRLFGHY